MANLICKIESLAAVATFIKAKFMIDETALTAYDTDLADPFIDDYQTKIDTVAGLLNPESIIALMGDNTANSKIKMDSIVPFLDKAEFAIKKCILNGSVTLSLKGFKITELRNAIQKHSIEAFNSAFNVTKAFLYTNRIALATKGFTTGNQTTIQNAHNDVMDLSAAYLGLEVEKNNLVTNNMDVFVDLSNDSKLIVNSGQSWARSYPVKPVKKAIYVMKKIVAFVVPPVAKEPRNRKLKATKTIIVHTDPPESHTLQFTLLTAKPVQLGRNETKDGEPTATMDLFQNQLLSIRKSNIPGTGPYVKLINNNFLNAVVRVFVIVP